MGIASFKVVQTGVNTPFAGVKEQKRALSSSQSANMRSRSRSRFFLIASLLLLSFFVACEGNPLQPEQVIPEPAAGTPTEPGTSAQNTPPSVVLGPVFTPESGNVLSTASLTISSGTEGANIHYTTDGSEPSSSSSSYTAPVSFGTIGIGNHTIKAIAVKEGYTSSAIAETSFTVSYSNTVVSPTFSPGEGNVLSTQSLTIRSSTSGAIIYFTTDGSDPTTSSTWYTSPQGFQTLGIGSHTIKAIAVKTGHNNSQIASTTFTVTQPTVVSPSFSPGEGNVLSTQSLTISNADEEAQVYYTTDGSSPTTSSSRYSTALSFNTLGTGSHSIKAVAVRPGYRNSQIITATFMVTQPIVLSPGFSPANGNVLSTESLTISTGTEGASIHYTTDGSEPTTSSSRYTSPLSFGSIGTGSHTIKAIAAKASYSNSPIVSTTFTVTQPIVVSPSFSPANGNVLSTQSLTISSADEDAQVYYTTDGSTPTTSSSRYTSPLSFGSIGTGSHTIKAIAAKASYSDSPIVSADFTIARDVDADNDGLIDISSLEMLSNIRYNLAGTSYKTGSGDPGSSAGAPTSRPASCTGRSTNSNLCGYELTQDLDFALAASYTGTVNSDWRPAGGNPATATNAGFTGFGAETGTAGGFTAIFEGNGYTINNLYSRASNAGARNSGLFRLLGPGGIVRNVGVTAAHVYGGGAPSDNVAALVGRNFGGMIRASHASGNVDGGGGNDDNVGALVGYNEISGSFRGTIMASYASATVDGGGGNNDKVGGLLGNNNSGNIIASYASGRVGGGNGSYDRVGGLIGYDLTGLITASYASGNADGGNGYADRVGGLVGHTGASFISTVITASYATGAASGGYGGSDTVGSLIGYKETMSFLFSSLTSIITESYGFGTLHGELTTDAYNGNARPAGVQTAADLRSGNAGSNWNNSATLSAGAWDFGTGNQNPALVYADYDGGGGAYQSCGSNNGGFSATIPGTSTTLVCGSSLVGGAAMQGR